MLKTYVAIVEVQSDERSERATIDEINKTLAVLKDMVKANNMTADLTNHPHQPQSLDDIERMAEDVLYRSMVETIQKNKDLASIVTFEQFYDEPFIKRDGLWIKAAMIKMYEAGRSSAQATTPIEEMVKQWHEWQVETFPGATAISKLHHLEEETDELIRALKRGFSTEIEKEFADCFALLFGSAYITGLTMHDIVRIMGDKLEINKARKWGTPDANGVVKHVEEGIKEQ